MTKTHYTDTVFLAALAATLSWIGAGMIHPGLLDWPGMDIWYDSDIPRVIGNMTIREEGHYGSFKHPLFALLVLPPTKLVQMVVGDAFTAVRVVLAANAALCILVLMALCARVGVGRMDRALAALVLIASSAFAFWFTVPETFAFGATTILIALFAAVHLAQGRMAVSVMVLCGVAALSMTITNFAVFVVALFVGLWVAHPKAGVMGTLRRGVWPMAVVLVACVVLALLQDQLFGDAGLFFNVRALLGETRFIGQTSAIPVTARPAILVLGALFYGGHRMQPFTTTNPTSGTQEVMQLKMPVYGMEGLLPMLGTALAVAVLLWACVVLWRARGAGGVSDGAWALAVTAGVSAAGFVVLHMIYGLEAYLYVAHMIPLLVVLTALGLMAAGSMILRGGVAVMVVLMALHNAPALVQAHEDAAAANFTD